MRDKLWCNKCGREIRMERDILQEDVFEGVKQWGYFSKKDARIDSFILCEECYDQMISQFQIPPVKRESTEY